MKPQNGIERFAVAGEDLLKQFEQIVHEGNVRRIIIKHDGHTVAEFPITVGVIGTALAPMLAAVGALAAALTNCTIEVERDDNWGEPHTHRDRAGQEAARAELEEAIRGEPVPRR